MHTLGKPTRFMRTLPAILLAATPALHAAEHDCGPQCTHGHQHTAPANDQSAGWFDRANEWSLFDGMISASLHGYLSYGDSSGDVSELQTGGHDPQRNGWTLQALEPSITIKPTDHLSAFANGLFFSDAAGDVSWEWEEVYGAANDLPGGIDLRGGQILNRVGIFNSTHIHQWHFVDMPLLTTRFLGDDGLITRSAEINWRPKIGDPLTNQSILTLSYGEVRPHDDHSHGGHGRDSHHEEDHHGEDELLFEEEGAHFNDRVFSTRIAHSHRFTDQHELTAGVSYIYGDNEFGRHNHVGGLDLTYRWNADISDPDAVSVLWKTEIFGRNVAARSGEIHDDEDHHDDEHGDHHEEDHHDEDHLAHDDHEDDHADTIRSRSFEEIGISSSVVASWSRHWDTGIRFDYVSGINNLGLNERIRISPNVTFFPDNHRRTHLRAQYNFDHSPDHGSDHTLWIQAGIALGSPH